MNIKLRFTRLSLVLLIFTTFIKAQDIITFDNQAWNNDQVLASSFSSGNYTFASNKNFYTNYGYNFNVNQISIYYVFQNSSTDEITISTNDNSLVDFISLGAYQVSETSTRNLIIEGWNSTSKLYSKSFSNVNTWQILTLNYSGINKLVIKLSSSTSTALVDYNFDNFTFNKITAAADTTSPELISASVINPTTITLIFSEAIDKNSAHE